MTQNKKSNQEIKITCESFVPGSLANPSVEVAVPGSLALNSKFVSSVFSLLVFHLSHLLFFLQTKTNVQERGVKENEMIQCNVPRSLAFNSKFVSVSSVVVFKQR